MDTSKDKASMKCNVVSWKGVLIPEVQEPITILPNELRDISCYLGNLRNV